MPESTFRPCTAGVIVSRPDEITIRDTKNDLTYVLEMKPETMSINWYVNQGGKRGISTYVPIEILPFFHILANRMREMG